MFSAVRAESEYSWQEPLSPGVTGSLIAPAIRRYIAVNDDQACQSSLMAHFQFEFETLADWPKLAWVAELRENDSRVRISCGANVERRDDWFCEAAWDGPFKDGDFDRTDIVAGSGARIRDRVLRFVSSGTILDRLNYIELEDRILVSNSLSAIVAVADAEIDITYPNYQSDLGTICFGLDAIHDRIESSRGAIRLVYFENLAWDGRVLAIEKKPRTVRDFSSFSRYVGFLETTMKLVVDNARSGDRQHPLEPLVPISNGYDSPAVAVLAKTAGARDAFTIAVDREGNDDSGVPIGEALGYDVRVIDRNDWRQNASPEIDCIAGSGATGEVAFDGLGDELSGRLLLSGFWGGSPWDPWPGQSCPTSAFPDHDGSGLCFTELRLSRGFVHCPVPFWGGLQIADLVRITRSKEMEPWHVPGSYNRPICRRIVEEAGIPRGSFATAKHGSSDQLMSISNFLPPSSTRSYRGWLNRNGTKWLRQGRIPPYPVMGAVYDGLIAYGLLPVLRRLVIPVMRRLADASANDRLQVRLNSLRETVAHLEQVPMYARRYTFPWALEISSAKYR
jgi:hypothetical protein